MHAGTVIGIVLGLVAVAGWALYGWGDREHFPFRGYRDTRRTTRSVVGAVVGVAVGSVFLIWLVAIAVLALETRICGDQARKLGTSSEYSWTAGCFIEISDELIPYELYRLQETL